MARRIRGFVKLEWVCPNCGTRNPGPTKLCTNCGAPQPDNVQFERAAEEQFVTDLEGVAAAQAGADYICPYCGTRNSALAKTCIQCGGDLVEAKRRAAGAELQANTRPKQVTCSNCGTENPSSRNNCQKCGAPLSQTAPSMPRPTGGRDGVSAKRSKQWIWALAGAAAVLCAGAVALFVVPAATVPATVTDIRWQTSVPVEAEHAVHYSNERGSPPGGAYNVSCHDESREVCEERTIDKGNGYGEVVQDCHTETEQYCSYIADEWQTVETYTLDGHDHAPVYSQPNLSVGQRLGDQSVDYSVMFQTDSGVKKYSPPTQSEFAQFSVGSTWTLSLNAVGAILDVRP